MMRAIQVIDSTHLVSLPGDGVVMVGAPPESLKLVLLWEFPSPSAVVLPPDPLYADGINQASFEFLLYNHLFRMGGLRDRKPFAIVCDAVQQTRVESLVRHMLRGPSDAEMAAWRTPANHRKQLLLETTVVSGECSTLRLEQMVRVISFEEGCAELPDGTRIEQLVGNEVRITARGESVTVPRRAQARAQLPLYFADVETPLMGPRFGLQIIGSASGFSGSEWSSCFIVWINGQPLIIDGTPYLEDHLRRLGIEDDHILGYLITHNHEDHANLVGQLVNRRPVTVITSGPVMASLIPRLAAILDCPESEVRHLLKWVPLHPGLDDLGEPLSWFGAEIRSWYSVHTVPTLGLDITMGGKHIRMPGDTLWGRQLDPLLEQNIIGQRRYRFIQHTYDGADVIVADAGGGPIHPDPQEVLELLHHHNGCQLLVTHIPEFAREFLPPAEPGKSITLIPRENRTPEEAMGLFGSPVLRDVAERWLLSLLYGGDVVAPSEAPFEPAQDALVVLAGSLCLQADGKELFPLQRGDVFHRSLLHAEEIRLHSTARWTRLLCVPHDLYMAFVQNTGIGAQLERLYRTRAWWRTVTGDDLGLDTLMSLAQLCRERSYPQGTIIVRQGDPANHFYVVTSGEVDIVHEESGGEQPIGRFGAGFHFGEIALLAQEVRTATVRAASDCSVMELPARAFRRHLMEIPLARYRISRAAEARKAELARRRKA